MRAIGYARVSTDKQADHGVSLEAQQQKIQAMAVVHGAELTEMIVDGGESAKSLNRPGMERLLALVDARQVDVVIMTRAYRKSGRYPESEPRAPLLCTSTGRVASEHAKKRRHLLQMSNRIADSRLVDVAEKIEIEEILPRFPGAGTRLDFCQRYVA